MTAPPLPGTDTVAQVAGGVFSVPPHATAAQWQRFLARVAVTPGCWFWCGALGSDGAGRWRSEPGVTVRPHRWAYEAVHGPLPRDAAVSQTCGEPSCVRWDAHLRVRGGAVPAHPGRRLPPGVGGPGPGDPRRGAHRVRPGAPCCGAR